ncbi:MAG: site-specific integrase [Sedimentisphaerales bacterium]|nr:site-specific integrase [Sedimentisphaerales bacterium]
MKQLVKLNKRPRRSGRQFTYALRYKDEYGKQRCESLGHANLRKAEQQRAQREKELQMGSFSSSMRLRDFLEDSLGRTGDQIRESTRRETRSAMEDFIGTIGNIDFQEVTLTKGEYYIQTCLDRGNSKGTVAKKLRHIKRVFKLAVNRKQLVENPLQHIAMPKAGKKKINIYSDDHCQRILRSAREYTSEKDPARSINWDLMIMVALAAGMRRAELLNCTWADVDFATQTIEVNAKTCTKDTWEWLIKDSDQRTLPLTEEIVQMLVDHQARQPEGYPYVFVPPTRYDHIQKVLRPSGKWALSDSRLKVVNNFKRDFDEILRRAGIQKGTFHDIRRTAISMWFANGMSEYDVMTLAGHSSFTTTHQFYLAVADDLIHRARSATAQGLSKKLGRFGTRLVPDEKEPHDEECKSLNNKDL